MREGSGVWGRGRSAFDDTPLPLDLTRCSANYNGGCSLTVSRHLVGLGLSATVTADGSADLEKAWYDMTFNNNYEMSGFYPFAHRFDSAGKGETVAHGANSDFLGLNLTEILAYVGNTAVFSSPSAQTPLLFPICGWRRAAHAVPRRS